MPILNRVNAIDSVAGLEQAVGKRPPGWHLKSIPVLDVHCVEFLARSPFITLTSTDAALQTDVSPKGDPAGFVVVLGPNQLALPDRPGNRRTDTFHNLIEHPEIAMLAFVPGDDRVLRVRGQASISQDEALRARGEVKGHLPSVMLVIDVAEVALERSPAMSAAGLWDPSRRISSKELPRASQIWTDHVKLNDDPGIAARVARLALRERLMRASLAADYQNNLY